MFKDKLKTLRVNKGISQIVIADYLGISQRSYSRYESGVNEPSLDTLKRIAHYFDVSIDYLLRSALNDLDEEQLRELLIDILNVFLKVLN